METTAMAAWLNTTFAGFDYAGFEFFHNLAVSYGDIFNPIFAIISLLGEKGLVFFVVSLILCFPRKTRLIGITCFIATCLGAFVNELAIKNVVCRPRPFLMSDTFAEWWMYVGAHPEDSFCFASSHVAAASSFFIALFLAKKNWATALGGIVGIAAMACSRVYLFAHYPSDVCAGIIVGLISAIIAYFIAKAIGKFLRKRGWLGNREMKLPRNQQGAYGQAGSMPVQSAYQPTGSIPVQGTQPTGSIPIQGAYQPTGSIPVQGSYQPTGNIPVQPTAVAQPIDDDEGWNKKPRHAK